MKIPSKNPPVESLPPSLSGRQIKALWGIAEKAWVILSKAEDFPKKDSLTRLYPTEKIVEFLKAHHLI